LVKFLNDHYNPWAMMTVTREGKVSIMEEAMEITVPMTD
jgi:hypothetical protein